MIIDEIWQQIEQHLLDRNWMAVTVWADALQETGEERLAGCIRWLAKRKLVTGYVDGSKGGRRWYSWIRGEQLKAVTLAEVVEKVQDEREWYL